MVCGCEVCGYEVCGLWLRVCVVSEGVWFVVTR